MAESSPAASTPAVHNRLPRLDILSGEQVTAIDQTAMDLLEEIGVRFGSPRALRLFRSAGLDVVDEVAHLDRGFVREQLLRAPERFQVRGRGRDRTVEVGGDHLVLAPTGGAPFVLDAAAGRRPPTAEDHRRFVRLTHVGASFGLNESGIVEPADLPVRTRHLDMDLDVLRWSDKPYYAVGATEEDARDSVDLAARAFGGREEIARAPVLLGIVNPISPLQYDDRMAGTAMSYAEAGQPVVLMPFVFAGGTAPLTMAGTLAQMTAEVLAGIALVQLVRPGSPVVFGSSVSELDLHDGQPRYATAFHGLAMLASGQLARHYRLPFRGGGGFTGESEPGPRAMQESLMALWPALLSGANLILHAAGWIEGSLATSPDKLALDVTALEELTRFLEADFVIDDETLAMEAFREVGPGGTFLGAGHTLRHLREVVQAGSRGPCSFDELLERYEDPGIDPAVEEALLDFVGRRKRELGG